MLETSSTVTLDGHRSYAVRAVPLARLEQLQTFAGTHMQPIIARFMAGDDAGGIDAVLGKISDPAVFKDARRLADGSIEPALDDDALNFAEGVAIVGEFVRFNVAVGQAVLAPLFDRVKDALPTPEPEKNDGATTEAAASSTSPSSSSRPDTSTPT